MNLLSIDASTKATGYAVFNNAEIVTYGCITSSSTDLFKRIDKMIDEIIKIIKEYKIDKIIMEEVIPDHNKNINTFKALMYLQAGMQITLHKQYPQLHIELIYPGTWRSVCGIKIGRGIARETLKQADIKFANQHFGLSLTSDDIADAICIGYSYIYPKTNPKDLNWD